MNIFGLFSFMAYQPMLVIQCQIISFTYILNIFGLFSFMADQPLLVI